MYNDPVKFAENQIEINMFVSPRIPFEVGTFVAV